MLVCLRRYTKECHFCPKLTDFLAHLFRVWLAWCTIGVLILLFCLFGVIIITRLQNILSPLSLYSNFICSGLLHVNVFFSIMLLFFILYLIVRWTNQVIFHFRVVFNLILGLIFILYIIWRLIQHTEPFRQKSNGSWVSSLFLGNRKKHMPVCPCATSVALAAGVFLVSILQAGDWDKVFYPI